MCANWHGLAKLRLHTDDTLNLLERATAELGTKMRGFADDICPAYKTRELRRETEARRRRQLKTKQPSNSDQEDTIESRKSRGDNKGSTGARPKRFNLRTYKWHSLGDYVKMIRQYGTTDSFSTESVSDLRSNQTAIPLINYLG